MSLKLSTETLKEAESVIKFLERPFGISLNPFDIPVVKDTVEKGVKIIEKKPADIWGKRRGVDTLNPRDDDGEPITRFPISIGETPGAFDLINMPDSINASGHSVSHAVPENWNPANTFIRNT